MQNGLWLCYLKQLGFFFTNQLTEDFYFKFYPRSILLKSGDETIEFLQHFFLSFSRYILRTGFRCDSDYRGLCDIWWWYCLTVKVFCKWHVWGWVFFPLFTLELGLREQAGEWELKQAMVSWKIFPESHITCEVQGCKLFLDRKVPFYQSCCLTWTYCGNKLCLELSHTVTASILDLLSLLQLLTSAQLKPMNSSKTENKNIVWALETWNTLVSF